MLEESPGLREGIPYVVIFFSLFLVNIFLSRILHQPFFLLLSFTFLILSLFTLYFFRDPDRERELMKRGESSRQVLSPADGTILEVKELFEPRYLQCPVKRISIFMSIFDCHVNRSPIEGQIEYLHYNPGRFISAFKEKASLANEQVSIGVIKKCEGDVEKRLLVTLIAGLIARRIVLWKKQSDAVRRGERIGMIRFGSRVDLCLPQEVEVGVKKGEKVFAGETVIGYW